MPDGKIRLAAHRCGHAHGAPDRAGRRPDDDPPRQGRNLRPAGNRTAAITYKLTKTLNLHVGDTVRVYLPGDDEPFTIAIGQIVYNNVTQGIYLNRTTWESLRKGEFVPTGLMLKNPDETYLAQLADMDEVDSLDYPAKLIDDMMQMLDSLSAVFTMLTCIALALAFVICYNMGLMNFVERTREYATLKVLGYHQKEIRRLIMRENSIISLFGVALGIWPGIALTDIIMHTCEPESGFYPGAPTDPIHRHRLRRHLSVLPAASAHAGAQGAEDRHG